MVTVVTMVTVVGRGVAAMLVGAVHIQTSHCPMAVIPVLVS